MPYCLCVSGWYFHEDFYRRLYQVAGEKYVVSHRDQAYFETAKLPPGVREDLLVFPNVGLDWGLYHQFNAWADLDAYDFVIYMHDDVVIKDTAFPQAVAGRLADPRVMVVGNGRNGTDWQFRYGKYGRRMFWPDDDDFIVRTVRGSFFAARTEVFRRLGNFPVYWKVRPDKPNKANISLRNFGYLVTRSFGRESIAYLDAQHYLDTRYLKELVRGESKESVRRRDD